MAVPRSMLLLLGLSLCCALHFSSASPTYEQDNCTVFDTVFTTNHSSITFNLDIFENNTVYTVWVPVNGNDSAVVLQALNKNNHSVGLWQDADENCNGSALYNLTSFNGTLFKANWMVPNTEDVSDVKLQVFNVNLNHTATLSSLKLGGKGKFASISHDDDNDHLTRPMTPTKTTARTTLATAKSLAIRALSSPIAGAIHILLVFLTSKLLF